MNNLRAEFIKRAIGAKIERVSADEIERNKRLSAKELDDKKLELSTLEEQLMALDAAFAADRSNARIEANRLELSMKIAALKNEIKAEPKVEFSNFLI